MLSPNEIIIHKADGEEIIVETDFIVLATGSRLTNLRILPLMKK